MEVDDLSQLTDFLFDLSTPETDEEARIAEEAPVAPAIEDAAPRQRVIRRRARKACVACHKRKVRCDVLARRHTCTNCRLDGVTCVIRSSGKRFMRDLPLPAPTEDDLIMPSTDGAASTFAVPVDTAGTISHYDVEAVGKPTSTLTTAAYDSTKLTQYENPAQTSEHSDLMFAYFDFMEAETLSHIEPEDFKFLEQKGCFHFPARPVLDDLVRQYFLHVHPALPLIDEHAFWELYSPSGKRKTIQMQKRFPLFVFRCMIFVSCSFASDETIRRLGFPNPMEARSSLYKRAKLLFDFDTTSDPIALSQGALILTYYSSDREPMANTTWLRHAIQHANSANVPMYAQDSSISAEERLTRKRLWWCLVLRDRILPLGVRRPIQITRGSFDFSQPKLSQKDLEVEFYTSRVYDKETKRHLARIFLALLDLAVELTDVISYVYPVNGFRAFDMLDYNSMLLMPSKIERCKSRLDTWHNNFKNMLPEALPEKHKSVSLFSGLNLMYYQSARAALCQCESFMLQADESSTHDFKMKELGSTIHSSIASISETIRDFIQLDVAKYLPVSAVAFMALPIVLNSLDLQNLSSTNARTDTKRRQLRLLNEAMDLCNERYTGTFRARLAIKKIIEVAQSEQNQDMEPNSTSLISNCPRQVPDWFEVFLSKPLQFLRISFSIDLSLAVGRYSERKDLPRRLSLHDRLIPSSSIPKSLMPAESHSAGDIPLTNSRWTPPTNNSFLDYLDFGDSQVGCESEASPWTGQTVDTILEEVIGGGARFWS